MGQYSDIENRKLTLQYDPVSTVNTFSPFLNTQVLMQNIFYGLTGKEKAAS